MPNLPLTQQTVTITLDGAGAGTGETRYHEARLAMIRYDGGHGAATLAITGTTSGQTLWSEAVAGGKTLYPTLPMHDETGAEVSQRDYPWIVGETITISVTGGTASSEGAFLFVWAD